MDHLHWLDWAVMLPILASFIFIGIYFRNRNAGTLGDFFLGGRRLPWYIAGVSMVATTFAADTPLWVTEKIAQHGISGNWLWWNMLIGGMLTTFFFARLWRRAEIITELELLELRYSGPVAQWLRGLKSVYLGLFLNVIIIGWVNTALLSILEVFFGVSYEQSLAITFGAMALVAVYSSISGLLGIAITDFVQFIIAMSGSIILAVVVLRLPEVGGIEGLQSQLPAWRFRFFPVIGSASDVAAGTFALSAGAFFSYLALQWWASWYPGNEPGGGGYISQRMMSAKDEKNAVYSSLFFQIAHYALRPWPWIIVGLAALVLYPELTTQNSRYGYVMAMRDHLPAGIKGLLLTGFISAYMSTISTQLNWGSSYLTNDLYRRFIRRPASFANELKANKHYVKAGRWLTVLIMLVAMFSTTQINMIDSAAQFLIASGAGLGMVLILRWYWWRINAWSELSASLAPFVGMYLSDVALRGFLSENFYAQNGVFIFTVVFTTIVWLLVTFSTPPEKETTLQNFYRKVRPGGWWGPFVKPHLPKSDPSAWLWVSWLSGTTMAYAILFSLGYGIFGQTQWMLIWLIILVISAFTLIFAMSKTRWEQL